MMSRRGRPPHPDILTPREWEILDLIREGLNNAEIAERLNISRDGVKYHVSQILSKLNVESREEAAAWQASEVRQRRWRWLFAPLALKVAGATVVAAAVGTVVLGASVIMSGDDGSTSAEDRCEGPPPRECIPTPVPLSTGRYDPDFSRDKEILDEMTLHRLDNRPPGPAAQIIGLDIYSDREAYLEAVGRCRDPDITHEGLELEDPVFVLTWVPPGTHEREPQGAVACPDGTVYRYYYALTAGPARFAVEFIPGPPALRIEPHAERAYEGEIGGRPAVIAVGDANRRWLGVAVGGGVLSLSVEDMPIADAIAVLEGVDCLICEELQGGG